MILPGWVGARARLAEAVLTIGPAMSLGMILGTFSLLGRAALLLAAVALAGAVELLSRRLAPADPEPDPTPGEQPAWSRTAALAVVALVFAHWGIGVGWSLDAGITNFDSVWYHLPFSAEMAQTGSTLTLVKTETVFLNWFYPQNSELMHALGMVLTGRDVVSLALNLGWLALAFLAAWCIGRPYGRGHLTVAAAAILFECHNLVAREPGTAKNDIVAVALLLAAAALLVNLAPRARWKGAVWLVVGLAVGLAAGTKVTALAPTAGLTLAAIAVAPSGRRLATALWWSGGLAIGGAYWYLRNLVVTGNPLPQVRELGPIDLPGPDRLQTGRPDFTVAHYLFDGAIWRDYFLPGLERGFGPLWPAVVAAAVVGAALALWKAIRGRRVGSPEGAGGGAGPARPDAALGWLGFAALVGMAVYLLTPLSAAGPEGSPTAFAINLRFVIPSLALGLVLLPLAFRPRGPKADWILFAALVLLCLVTNRADTTLTDSGRLFGWAVALVLVVVPALIAFGPLARLDGGSGAARVTGSGAAAGAATRRVVALGLAWTTVLVAVGFALQRGYFENRYADFKPELGLSQAYRWSSDQSGLRIGLAGTTAGFHGFGFYGADLSNRVVYLGRDAKRGGFDAIDECAEFRRAVNRAGLDYLVTAPFLNFIDIESPIDSPEARWIAADPTVEAEIVQGDVTLWRIEGPLSESCGPTEEPHRQLPDTML